MANTRQNNATTRGADATAGIAPGIGCLFAVALCMARTSDALPGLWEHGELFAAVCGLLGGMVLAVLAVWVVRAASARRRARRAINAEHTDGSAEQPGQQDLLAQPLLAGALCLAGIAGIALLECGVLPHESGDPLARTVTGAAGVLTGAGIALLALAWADAIARERPARLVRHAAWGIAVAAICYATFRCVAGIGASCGLLALYAVASAGLCHAAARRNARGTANDAEAGHGPANDQLLTSADQPANQPADQFAGRPAGQSGDRPADRARLLVAMADGGARVARMPAGSVRLRDLYRMLWIALAGALLSAFIVGLTWDPEAAYETSLRTNATSTWGPLAGALLASAGVLVASKGHDDEVCLRLLSSVFLPIALALVLVAPVVRQTSTDPLVQLCCSVASTMGFALFALAGFAELVLAAQLSGASPSAAVGGVLIAIAACVWAGFAAIGVWGTSGRIICLLFEAALLTAISISYALRPRAAANKAGAADGKAGAGGGAGAGAGAAEGPAGNTVESPGSPDDPNAVRDARCARLAARGALSQREAEVLVYLARGHGSAFTASELGISENTVRTHARHIYEKLGVSSREELLALVNGRAE